MTVLRTVISAAALAIPAIAAGAGASAPTFGKPLQCAAKDAMPASILAAAPAGTTEDLDWALQAMQRIGYPVKAPNSALDRDHARQAAGLLRTGHLVAAKMAHEESTRSKGYTDFGAGFAALLTIVTQPVTHASYPSEIRADGESRAGKGAHTHGVDLESSSLSLSEVILRAEASKKALGTSYTKPAVRYYVLAQGFRDDLALAAASRGVCDLKLEPAVIAKLDITARFMAAPSAHEEPVQ